MDSVKWRDFKPYLVIRKCLTDPLRLATPRLINLITDAQEREPASQPQLHSWGAKHFNRIIGEFHASVQREPLMPIGAATQIATRSRTTSRRWTTFPRPLHPQAEERRRRPRSALSPWTIWGSLAADPE
jgi:hypothetical protein